MLGPQVWEFSASHSVQLLILKKSERLKLQLSEYAGVTRLALTASDTPTSYASTSLYRVS